MCWNTNVSLLPRSTRVLASGTFISSHRGDSLKLFLEPRSRSERSFDTQLSSSSLLQPRLICPSDYHSRKNLTSFSLKEIRKRK